MRKVLAVLSLAVIVSFGYAGNALHLDWQKINAKLSDVGKESFTNSPTGKLMDYVKKGLNEGFEFKNPNVAGECGCGESFTV